MPMPETSWLVREHQGIAEFMEISCVPAQPQKEYMLQISPPASIALLMYFKGTSNNTDLLCLKSQRLQLHF